MKFWQFWILACFEVECFTHRQSEYSLAQRHRACGEDLLNPLFVSIRVNSWF